MITSMSDLIRYQKNLYSKLGENEFNADVLIQMNCTAHYTQNHFSATCLPSSYINTINSFDINGVVVAGFSISPSSGKQITLEKKLESAILDPFFPKEFMQLHKLYQIGFYNTDIICITEGIENYLPGEILFIDEGDDIFDPQDEQIHPLAPNFEIFLILAGNLNQIYQVIDHEDYNALVSEFERRLIELNINKRYWPAWVRLI